MSKINTESKNESSKDMIPEPKQIRLSEIVFNEDIYPRKEHDPSLVQCYADCLESIEARGKYMSVAKDNTLLDGRHRHMAYRENKLADDVLITVLEYPVESNKDKFELAVELNSSHGKQLSQEDKKKSVITLFTEHGVPPSRAAKIVSVRKKTALNWTESLRKEQDQLVNEKISDLHLSCHTAQEISEAVGLAEQTVRDRIDKITTEKFHGTRKWRLSNFKDFDDQDGLRPIYNVRTFGKKTNGVSHFGNSEQRIVDNLIYLYTEPFDIVLDPFAGGGSTIDACKMRLRRYWTSDRKPIVARANEIRKLDIGKELPPLHNRWSDVSLTYLDPPYWKQAENQYSDSPDDLANMSLEDFNDCLSGVELLSRVVYG